MRSMASTYDYEIIRHSGVFRIKEEETKKRRGFAVGNHVALWVNRWSVGEVQYHITTNPDKSKDKL